MAMAAGDKMDDGRGSGSTELIYARTLNFTGGGKSKSVMFAEHRALDNTTVVLRAPCAR